MDYTTIFTDLEDFRSYAEGLQADTAYRQLHPSIRTTALEMEKIITKDAFEAIASGGWTPAATEEVPEPSAIDLSDVKVALKVALAAGTMYRYQIFASVKRNGSDASLYKYQHEELKDNYIENYWKAMDDLLNWLDNNPTVAGYNSSPAYMERQQLPVKNADEFERYFGINRSSFFYAKVLYLIRDSWKTISARISGYETNEAIMDAARKALCYTVMAKVVKRFDLTEFPRSLRFDYNHEYTRGSSTPSRDALCADLMAEVTSAMDEVATLIRRLSDNSPTGNTNEEKDRFYFTI